MLWHLRWNQFCCRTLPILQKDIFWYPYFDSGWRNVCRWNPITAVFVKWHLRWNQLGKLIANIARGHILISFLWLCMKECLQVKPYMCLLCELTFKMKSVLKSHIAHIAKSHFQISLLWLCVKECLQMKPYKFSLCVMTFKIVSVLQTHIAQIAKRNFMISILWLWLKEWMQIIGYECSLCEMTFKINCPSTYL